MMYNCAVSVQGIARKLNPTALKWPCTTGARKAARLGAPAAPAPNQTGIITGIRPRPKQRLPHGDRMAWKESA
jgi:hypothetical protein